MTGSLERRGWMPSMGRRAAQVALAFLMVLGIDLVVPQLAKAGTFTVLYSFSGAADRPLITPGEKSASLIL